MSENQIQFSIIVPVYNTERYIRTCVDSILTQTYKNFELILVDDGSEDHSPQICDEYKEKDSRTRVIHQNNAGVSAARNCGLKAAHGLYIWFIDSDDWIQPNSLASLHNIINSRKAEIYGFQSKISKEIYCDHLESFLQDNYFPYIVSFTCWNKLYRHSFLQKYHIRFDEDETIGEDLLFNLACYAALFMEKKNIYLFPETYYHYRDRENSAMKKAHKEALKTQLRLYEKTCVLLGSHVSKDVLDQFYLQYLVSGILQSRNISVTDFTEAIQSKPSYIRKISKTAKNNFLKAEKASPLGILRINGFVFFINHQRYAFAAKLMGLK